MTDPLLSPKELAAALGRHRTFVFAMRRQGFAMPGNRATVTAAVAWLVIHPKPRGRGTLRNTAEHSRSRD